MLFILKLFTATAVCVINDVPQGYGYKWFRVNCEGSYVIQVIVYESKLEVSIWSCFKA